MKYHYQERVIIPFAKSHKRLVTAMVAVIFAFMWTVGLLARVNAAPTEVVTGDTFDGVSGWTFGASDPYVAPFEFNTDEASEGDGALFVGPIGDTAQNKFIAYHTFDGLLASELENVAYDFMVASAGAMDYQQFYLNIYTNLPGSGTYYDCRFDIVPSSGAMGSFETVTYNSTDAATVAAGAGCPSNPATKTLADMPAGSTVSFMTLNVGDTSTSDVGVQGYYDNVVVTIGGEMYPFDFEPLVESVEITSPVSGETVSGVVSLMASYVDTDPGVDPVFWAVREGSTCSVSGAVNVFGNVDGRNDDFDWDGSEFAAYFDSTEVSDGTYCFVINPDGNNNDVRAVVSFEVDNAPVVTIESPMNGDVLSGTVDVVGTIEDGNLSHYNISLYPASTNLSDGGTHSGDRLYSDTVYGTGEFMDMVVWEMNTADYEDGMYQIRLAARDLAGNRDTTDPYNGDGSSVHVIMVEFDNRADNADECKKGGWILGLDLDTPFRNQGDCVSHFSSDTQANRNPDGGRNANGNGRR